ncbi:MAG: O-antigen ligase family protein [Anaerolineales bacterium]|nr:O-antigen ligase family protein [Anaerolineales bacterium]
MNKFNKRWIAFGLGCLLLVAAFLIVARTRAQEDEATRGWTLASEQQGLPYRVPLAGINADLTLYPADEIGPQLDKMSALGFVWVRQTLSWADVEPSAGMYDWSIYDPIVEVVSAYSQLQLIIVLDGTPTWARDPQALEHPFAPPANPDDFVAFAAAVAERYGSTIDYYQIWDEPNLEIHWGGLHPDPERYTTLLQGVYSAIHANDSTATVIAAALAPTDERGPENWNEVQYLEALYAAGAKNYFDAAAGKPYGYDVGPYDRTIGPNIANFSRIITLREVMVAHDDGDKALWGSNFGWNHLPDGWQGDPSIWGQVSADDQIRYTHEAYQRTTTEWPWMGGLILQNWQPPMFPDDPMQGFSVALAYDYWLAAGPVWTTEDSLTAGLYPVQNPLTTFAGEWQFGSLGADARPISDLNDPASVENTVTFQFYGTDLGLVVRRYPVVTAYYMVSIDGSRANALPTNKQGESQLVLKAEQDEGESIDLITVATGLEETTHTAVITHRPRQGDDAWGLVGIGVATRPDTASYVQGQNLGIILTLLGLGIVVIAIPYHRLRLPAHQQLRWLAEGVLAMVFAAVFLYGLALSWGDTFASFVRRDPPAILLALTTISIAFFSPAALITVLALLAFGVLAFNRPVLGLMAVAFWSMFFATTLDTYFRLIAAVEVMLAVSFVAVFSRYAYDLARKDRRQAPRLFLYRLATVRLSGIDMAMLAFVVLATVSLSWADLRGVALREWRVMIVGPAVYYLLLRMVNLSLKDRVWLVDTVLLGASLIAVVGLRNYLTGEVIVTGDGSRRLIAIYGSPNSVALHLGRCLPFALTYALLPVSTGRRVFGIVTALIMGLAILLTQSVAGILLGVPAAIAIILIGWQGQRAWRWLVGLGAMGGLALIPLMQFIPRLRNLTNWQSNSTVFRVHVWRSTVEMLKDHPLTGVGLDQFLYAYRSRYILPEGSADPNLSHPHNFILDYWVRLGILGVGVGLWLQVVFWRTALHAYRQVRHTNPLAWAIVLGSMGFMADFVGHGLIDAAYFFINLSFLFVLPLVLVQETKVQ